VEDGDVLHEVKIKRHINITSGNANNFILIVFCSFLVLNDCYPSVILTNYNLMLL